MAETAPYIRYAVKWATAQQSDRLNFGNRNGEYTKTSPPTMTEKDAIAAGEIYSEYEADVLGLFSNGLIHAVE